MKNCIILAVLVCWFTCCRDLVCPNGPTRRWREEPTACIEAEPTPPRGNEQSQGGRTSEKDTKQTWMKLCTRFLLINTMYSYDSLQQCSLSIYYYHYEKVTTSQVAEYIPG